MKGMRDLSKEDRPVIGQLVNEVRDFINDALDQKFSNLRRKRKK